MPAMRASGRLALVVVASAALAGVTQIRGQQTSTFRSGSTTVSIFATVSDDTHRLVPALTADDFLVLDDGAPQTITVFDRSAVPITTVVLLDASESMSPDRPSASRRCFRIRRSIAAGRSSRVRHLQQHDSVRTAVYR